MKLKHPCVVWFGLVLAAAVLPPAESQDARLQELNTQVAQLSHQGKYAEAVPLATEAVIVAVATYGQNSAMVATELNALGLAYYYQGKYVQAEPIFLRAMAIAEKALGPDSADLASDLGNLALNYSKEKKYAEAIPALQRAASIYEKALGPDNFKVAMALNGEAGIYFSEAHYAQAEPLYVRVVAILEKDVGPDRPEIAMTLLSLADTYLHENKDAQAEPLYERILNIYEKVQGPNGPDRPEVAGALEHLGQLYVREEKYAEAEQDTQRALGMYEKVFGSDNPAITNDLSELALVELRLAKYTESEALYKRALAIYEKADGPDHLDVAQAVNNLADLYSDQGRYSEADALYQRALQIRVKALGPNDPQVLRTLNNMARLYGDEGEYPKAESLYLQILDTSEKAHLPEDRNLATFLNNLASLYVHEGKYAQAEPLFQRSLHINETQLGPDHLDVAYNLNNLASLYEEEGKTTDAEMLFKRSLSIREKDEGPDHPDVAAALANLGKLYEIELKYADAKPLFLRAIAIDTKVFGANNPTLAAIYQDVAVLLMEQGMLSQAGQFYQQSLTINEKALGPDNPEVGSNLSGIGLVDSYLGKYDEAEPLFQRAIKIEEATFGPNHENTGTALENFALMYDREGKVPEAERVYTRANDNLFHQFQYSFSYMTEKDRLSFLDKVTSNFQAYFSFVHRNHAMDPQIIGSMYNLLLWEKGFVAGSVANMRRQVEASGDAEALKLLGQLNDKRAQLAALLNSTPGDREQWRKNVEQLETEASDIEKALVARSSAFAEQKQLERATWQQVRDALKPGEAAVEFACIHYRDYHQLHWTFDTYYVALVVTHDAKDHPEYVFLGNEKQMEGEAMLRFKQSVQTRGLQAEQEANLPGADAYALIWKPLEASLAGKIRVYLSPDGVLNQLPLGVIAAPDNKLLMERYDIRLLSSTRDILRSVHPIAAATSLLVGDPVFDLSEQQQRAAMEKLALPQSAAHSAVATPARSRLSRDAGSGLGSQVLPRLPGTGAEVAAVAGLMKQYQWKTNVYTNDLALKTVVERSSSPRVLHLATHGFFLPDQQVKSDLTGVSGNLPSRLEDPMLRSGLYFAGADRVLAGKPPADGLDNGVLTALEAGSLDLRGTQLVVLSACNTGQGDVKTGEGVFGLRRALEEAGAQSVLMTLWSVPDQETLELMQIFYKKWLSGTEVHQALKEAQLGVRETVRRGHDGQDLPYYWGAFVLVGR